jgi:hypothetical protein
MHRINGIDVYVRLSEISCVECLRISVSAKISVAIFGVNVCVCVWGGGGVGIPCKDLAARTRWEVADVIG